MTSPVITFRQRIEFNRFSTNPTRRFRVVFVVVGGLCGVCRGGRGGGEEEFEPGFSEVEGREEGRVRTDAVCDGELDAESEEVAFGLFADPGRLGRG